MYPISETILTLFKSEQRQMAEIKFETADDTIIITDSDILSGGLVIDRYCVSGEKIEIGSAVAAELTLKLNNADGRFNNVAFEGAELFVQIGVKDWSDPNADTFYIPMGYFTVDTVPRKLAAISITALDRMVRFDKDWDSPISFPTTVGELLTDCCNNCNVLLETVLSGLPNYDYPVTAKPAEEGLTYRQIVQWCAELMGVCAYIDWYGHLRLEWYGDTDVVFDKSNRFSSDLYETPITITGVAATVNDVVYLAGSAEYAINIEGNLLLQDDIDRVLSNLNAKLNGFSYTPFEATTTPAPYIYPLDRITFKDKNDVSHQTIITNATFTINANTSFSGKGETAVNNSYAAANPLTKRQQVIIQTIQKEVNEALNNRVQVSIGFNDLICNALGLYFTSVQKPDGSYQYYMHDNPQLESSNTIYTINAGGFAYTNKGWNNGEPVWEYGFSKNGNAVFKMVSAYGVEVSDPNQDYSAQMIPTGFDIYYRTQKVLTVNEQRTEITDVLVKRRLESGKIQLVPHEEGADFIYVD